MGHIYSGIKNCIPVSETFHDIHMSTTLQNLRRTCVKIINKMSYHTTSSLDHLIKSAIPMFNQAIICVSTSLNLHSTLAFRVDQSNINLPSHKSSTIVTSYSTKVPLLFKIDLSHYAANFGKIHHLLFLYIFILHEV